MEKSMINESVTMEFEQFLSDYFINPIVEHSGYNIINTLFYAIIAMIAAYLIFKRFRKQFTRDFILHTVPFILLGSTVRVITDSIDSGVAQQHASALFGLVGAVVNSGAYNYGFLTVTPGIYILVGSLTIFSLVLSNILRMPKLYPAIGLALWVPHFAIVLGMMSEMSFALLTLVISALLFGFSHLMLQRYKIKGAASRLAVGAHILDGASSFVAIEVFNRVSPQCLQEGMCYFGQHVVERFFGELMVYGTAIYLMIKVLFAMAASIVIEKEAETENEKYFIYLLIIIFGLAPGIRNFLRLALGV